LDTAKRQIELWEKSQRWIRDNPELFQRFIQLALEKATKNQTFGIGALTERVRWDWPDEAASRGLEGRRATFKVPNECRRYIAIAIYDLHPHVEAYCTTKRDMKFNPHLVGQVRTRPEDVVDDPNAVITEPFRDAALDDLEDLFS
jgi:hypothetical protein